MVSGYNFVQALERYVVNLKNNLELATTIQSYNVVKMQVNHKGTLIITEAETFEKEVLALEGKLKVAETELKQAKKTVSAQEKEIEDLNTQLETEKVVLEKTEEIEPVYSILHKPKKRRTKKNEDS